MVAGWEPGACSRAGEVGVKSRVLVRVNWYLYGCERQVAGPRGPPWFLGWGSGEMTSQPVLLMS